MDRSIGQAIDRRLKQHGELFAGIAAAGSMDTESATSASTSATTSSPQAQTSRIELESLPIGLSTGGAP